MKYKTNKEQARRNAETKIQRAEQELSIHHYFLKNKYVYYGYDGYKKEDKIFLNHFSEHDQMTLAKFNKKYGYKIEGPGNAIVYVSKTNRKIKLANLIEDIEKNS